jgi:hypothetical protein
LQKIENFASFIKKKKDAENIEQAIAFFLPIYGLWTAIVVFIIPLLFGFK